MFFGYAHFCTINFDKFFDVSYGRGQILPTTHVVCGHVRDLIRYALVASA